MTGEMIKKSDLNIMEIQVKIIMNVRVDVDGNNTPRIDSLKYDYHRTWNSRESCSKNKFE